MILASGGWQMTMTKAQSESAAKDVAKALHLPYPLRHTDLIQASAEIILSAQMCVVEGKNTGHVPFQPVIEGELLTDHPAELLRKGVAKGVSALVVYHEEEEAYFAAVAPAGYRAKDRRGVLEKVRHHLVESTSLCLDEASGSRKPY